MWMTRYWKIIRYCAAIWIAAVSVPALALDTPQPDSGAVQIRSTPCMRAKYNKATACPLPALADGADAMSQAKARLSRANYYIDIGQLKNAFVEADEALKLDPDNVDTRHLVARLALSIGDSERAEHEIGIALQKRPDDVNLQATNAARFIDVRPDEALRLFDKILTEHPDHRFSRESRARLQLTLGRPKDAVTDLDILLAGKERDADLLALRADANTAAGNLKQAIADLTQALSESPDDFVLLTNRAMANQILGDDNAALADLNSLLGPVGGNPNYAIGGNQLAQYRMQRAFVLVHLKRFADAATDAVEALSVGGRRSLLQAQIFLRHNGFPEVPLDGQSSESLKQAMQACMGLNSCFEKVSSSI
jgi:tetratricopeptide (TPR) repeat protein